MQRQGADNKIRVAILGITGHTGEALLRLLLRHRCVEIAYLSSTTKEAFTLKDVYPWAPDDLLCEPIDIDRLNNSDCVFLALPHTISMLYVEQIKSLSNVPKIIDLSADFRFKDKDTYEKWYKEHTCPQYMGEAVYGLCEVFDKEIRTASLIANPGCYPTAVLLGLFPLVKAGLMDSCIVDAKSGASGAGRKVIKPMMFMELAENMYAYKINSHQHAPEMTSILGIKEDRFIFVPHIMGIRKGILANMYVDLKSAQSESEIYKLYEDFYSSKMFVKILQRPPKLSDVQDTNYCFIHIKSLSNGKVLVVCAIDNIIKGASGQAIQNMNLLFNFSEEEGLL